ncbi:hypothetical protein [Algoriphagus sp. CAU 1675]|uniref:hypothetical protein n=1 Tax=Algoriphagus sp. CAU 1675 TaxID=3032597 RepID=UPI0023DADF99|nr:hypothetical protein [Algoriphagus sp. CAU 1675]MDF2157393.1 hypothetical protein [Algoriphagus sp. CAU 1675]
MRRVGILLVFLFWGIASQAQVKYVARFEVETDFFDPVFETVNTANGLVSFRTLQKKVLGSDRTFQYFISDENLNSKGIIELPAREGYDMVGYDTYGKFLYILFQRGYSLNAEKYVLQIDLETGQGFEYLVNNVLEMELVEFFVQEDRVIFLGNSEGRPAIQVYNLTDKRLNTIQGIYGNNTQILQIQKMPDVLAFEVVLSRKGKYKDVEISINTYDLDGNLLRSIQVEEFGESGQEIMDALLVPKKNYGQMMVGAFGLERRDSYQGMYLMDINEFGEYGTKFYTLEDFPNFYNYMTEKSKIRKDKEVLKEIDKNKIPSIRNVYSIRMARQMDDGYYFYLDHYDVINPRGSYRNPYSASSIGTLDRLSRMRYGLPSTDPFYSNRYPVGGSYQVQTEYNYISAHFVKLGSEGQVLWDNAATYDDLSTVYPMGFGEVAIIGDELYHAYVKDKSILLAYFKNGEKIFDNLDFEIDLINENERIADTNSETLQLVHWYDRYYILSGTQRVRYQDESGAGKSREVFFLTKVLVAGDLYEPEDSPK